MAYLFGWRESDIGATTGTDAVGNPDTVYIYDDPPGDGFLVPEDCTIKQIYVGTSGAGISFRAAIYNGPDNVLLAVSANVVSTDTGMYVDIPDTVVTGGSRVSIALHMGGYLKVLKGGTMAFKYKDSALFADPTPDPWVSSGTNNSSQIVIWADGDPSQVPTITETVVASWTDDPLPASVEANYTVYDIGTGNKVISGTTTISNGNLSIPSASLSYSTTYDLRIRVADGSRDRSCRVTTAAAPA